MECLFALSVCSNGKAVFQAAEKFPQLLPLPSALSKAPIPSPSFLAAHTNPEQKWNRTNCNCVTSVFPWGTWSPAASRGAPHLAEHAGSCFPATLRREETGQTREQDKALSGGKALSRYCC